MLLCFHSVLLLAYLVAVSDFMFLFYVVLHQHASPCMPLAVGMDEQNDLQAASLLCSITLLFERESAKFQLALLACYINLLAGAASYRHTACVWFARFEVLMHEPKSMT